MSYKFIRKNISNPNGKMFILCEQANDRKGNPKANKRGKRPKVIIRKMYIK